MSLHLEKIMKKILLTAVMLMTGVAAFAPTQADAQVGVSIGIGIGNAPPPPRYEVAPPQRYGYVWIPGYWNWDGRQYEWIRGYWERARVGYFYEEPRWVQGPNGWVLQRGGWREGDRARWEYEHRVEHYDWHQGQRPPPRPGPGGDRNHDGVPDRFEHDDRGHHGNGDRDRDGVPNRADQDRDGDGVPNRYDSRPDNPYRK
jgi:hypothetical protein